MKKIAYIPLSLTALVGMLFPAERANAQEPKTEVVFKATYFPEKDVLAPQLRADGKNWRPFGMIAGGNFVCFVTRPKWGGPNQNDIDVSKKKDTFQVYDHLTVNQLLEKEREGTTSAIADSATALRENLQAELIKSVNEIPAKLLTNEAKASIRESVIKLVDERLSGVEKELEELRALVKSQKP